MGERVRVLRVDDQEDAAASTAALVTLRGYEARACRDGSDALAVLADFRPHVCVLDLTMPGMSGVELASCIRAAYGPVRVVALTGRSHEDSRHRTSNAAFDAHLVEPTSVDDLVRAVRGDAVPTAVGTET